MIKKDIGYDFFFKKKYRLKQNKVTQKIIIIFTNIHPVIALIGLNILILHGYIFLKVLYGFYINIVVILGIIALLLYFSLFISGSILKLNMKRSDIRRTHFMIVIVFIISIILHKYFMI